MTEPMSDERLAEARGLATANFGSRAVQSVAGPLIRDLLAELDRVTAALTRVTSFPTAEVVVAAAWETDAHESEALAAHRALLSVAATPRWGND